MPVIDAVFVIILVLSVCSVIGAAVFARHRERMSMIEKGLKAEDMRLYFEKRAHQWSPLNSLKWGMLLFSVGVAILLGILLQGAYYLHGGIYPALIALCGGAALMLFYFIARNKGLE